MNSMRKVMRTAPRSLDEFLRMILSRLTSNLVVRFLGIRKLQIVEVSSVASAWIRRVDGRALSTQPRILGQKTVHGDSSTQVSSNLIGPGVALVSEAEVRYNTKFPAVITANQMLIPDRIEPGPFELWDHVPSKFTGGIIRSEAEHVLLKKARVTLTVDVPLLYAGLRSPRNWSHWLINFLMTVHVAQINGFGQEWSLVVPRRDHSAPTFDQSLKVYWPHPNVTLLGPDTSIRTTQVMAWAQPPVYDNPRSRVQQHLLGIAANQSVVRSFSARAWSLAQIQSTEATESAFRIFLARGSDDPRSSCSQSLIERAEDMGFEVIFPDRLDFFEQVKLFATADEIVGPAGSGFANVVYCKAGARILTWVDKFQLWRNYYGILAEAVGARMYHFEIDEPDPTRGSHAITAEEFARKYAEFSRSLAG